MPAQAKKTKPSTLKTEPRPVEVMPVRELKTLLTWKAPVRPFKRRDKEFWTTAGSIAFLLAVILFFIKEWLLIIVIIAVMFVYYVLSNVQPEKIEHSITNRGIRFATKDYLWENLDQFWFSEKFGQKILNVETNLAFPGRLQLLLGKTTEKQVKDVLIKYLREETPEPTILEKTTDWFSEKVPLETTK
jgi:hypothetical protein